MLGAGLDGLERRLPLKDEPIGAGGPNEIPANAPRLPSDLLEATQRFYTGNPQRQSNNQRRALRRLATFVHIVQTGLDRGTFDTDCADLLLQLATDAGNALSQAIP